MSNTRQPLSVTFDDLDITACCLDANATPALGAHLTIEQYQDLVFAALLPHPAAYDAVNEALRRWLLSQRPG